MSHTYDNDMISTSYGNKSNWSFEAGQKIFQGDVIHPDSFDRTVFE